MLRFTPVLAMTIWLGACGIVTGDYGVVSTPGRFAHMSCEDMSKRYAEALQSERKQIGVMERAMTDPAGFFVNVFVYSSPLASQRGEVQRIEEQAKQSNCELAPSPAAGPGPGALQSTGLPPPPPR